MAHLRGPEGCAWDQQQNYSSLVPHMIGEAYEVADAALKGEPSELCDELGDLLLQVVFYAQIAQEKGEFSFDDVVRSITDKLIRRHPHIFGELKNLNPQEVAKQWDAIKLQEKGGKPASLLDKASPSLPPLLRAEKLAREAAKVGFDWNNALQALEKVEEELKEVRDAIIKGNLNAIQDEIGDLLFATVNVARLSEISSDNALMGTNEKFCKRFQYIEQELAKQNKSPSSSLLHEMEALWEKAKTASDNE
jgi:MazG family protein